VFKKDVSNFPQTVSTSSTLQEILPPDQYAATLETLTPQQVAWVVGGGSGGARVSTPCASSRTRPAARSRVRAQLPAGLHLPAGLLEELRRAG
jgi:hypothetical protein